MKTLSVRAPWWWFIVEGHKDIENRDWPTKFRGRVLIHASKWFRGIDVAAEFSVAYRIAARRHPNGLPPEICPNNDRLRRSGGAIVGCADIVDCVKRSKSPWFFGEFGFVLSGAQAFPSPVPCPGKLGLFDLPSELEPAVLRQIRGDPHA